MKEEDRYSKHDILWILRSLLIESKRRTQSGIIRPAVIIKTEELQATINEIQSLRAENAELRRYVKDNRLI